MKVYKIGVTDDHILFAEGISNIITHKTDMELSFIASSVPELFKLLKVHLIDFLLLDVNLPPYNGIEVLEQLKKEQPALKIMILSMYQPIDIGITIDNFKGDAYVLKISGKHVLETALECMKTNTQYFDPNILTINPVQDSFTNQLKLSKREKEIISLIAMGKTSKEIAGLLFLSELTVKTHRKNISEKLGTKGLANLISKSFQLNKK
ncbi:MAG: response regulator transcription factor [Chitinophagaceae bacterium]|jgi:DNA-binding NarL/FixJ family response regulator|nr:response regulator transcription factor [Chitinophagaceae bacterium]